MKLIQYNLRAKRVIAGIVLLAILQGCSSISTVYNWADTFIEFQIDRQFNLTRKQKADVDIKVNSLLLRHKKQEFPKYKTFLSEIKKKVQGQFVQQDVQWFIAELTQYNTNMAYLLADDAAGFLSGISTDQINYLQTRLVNTNEEWLEEQHEKIDRSERKKVEDLYERIEEWIGELTDAQKKEIAEMQLHQEYYISERFQHRQVSQQQFIALLKYKRHHPDFKENLLNWYLASQEGFTEDYKHAMARQEKLMTDLVLLLSRTATQQQKNHFSEQIDRYLKELNEIYPG